MAVNTNELSIGSLYFVEASIKLFGANTIAAIPVSIKQNNVSLYFISVYEYNILKYSNDSITIIPSKMYRSKLLTAIARISKIKEIVVNKKAVCRIVDLFADKISCGGNMVYFRLKKKEVSFTDSVYRVYNNQIIDLKLHPIKRIIDISKWPRKAIMGWARSYLDLGANSLEYIYNSSDINDNRGLIDLLQKHHTYSANKVIAKPYNPDATIDITTIGGLINTINISTEHNIDTNDEFFHEEIDDIPF